MNYGDGLLASGIVAVQWMLLLLCNYLATQRTNPKSLVASIQKK
jgi:hypothetical protein